MDGGHEMIPVVWKSYVDSPARGYWDQEILEWLFTRRLPGGFRFQHYDTLPDSDGLVMATPGHWRDTESETISGELARYRWVLLMVTSDEEGACPYWQVQHPNLLVWRSFGRPSYSHQPDRYLPLGWTPGTLEANEEPAVKNLDWLFAGQITHARRSQLAMALKRLDGGVLYGTEGFTQGWDRDEYFTQTRRAKIIPCPSGPKHPDTFRMYEALESGAIPVGDFRSPSGVVDPWGRTFHTRPPFPIVDDWQTIWPTMKRLLADWPESAHRVSAWWQQTKRALVWQLHDDLVTLIGGEPDRGIDATERITVLMPTSPIARHPDVSMILETIQSVRSRLPHAEILIMIDGVRPEQEHYRERYNTYKSRLLWISNRMENVTPVLFDEFRHQANMTRHTLELVRTPLILFVEHDTPLIGEIPFAAIGHQILSDRFNAVRFHYDTKIHPDHQYLMGDVETFDGVRYLHTRQWSQRPHLARTDVYRKWIDRIAVTSRTMIEDALHGPCANGDWDEWRLAIYRPAGNMQRSGNLDGRGTDPKYEMIYQ